MASDDKPQKPLPSAEELNAYLELSAARTKKRLTLAAGNAVPMKAPAKLERSLRVADGELGKSGGVAPAPPGKGQASGDTSGAKSTEPAWRPFSSEDEK